MLIDKGEYTVLDYVYQDADTFADPELMECRGIKFDKNGLILARPFRKFFNYGEQGAQLPIHQPHVITEKLDGSMIHPAKLDRRVFMMTRKGHTDVAKQAERHILSAFDIEYLVFCLDMMKAGWTPIFEYIGPDNRIVLRYETSSLVLLAMRHTIEGHIMPYSEMLAKATQYNVPVVQPPILGTSDLTDVAAFVAHTRALEDAEGYVVYFPNHMVKIKADDYVVKHRAIDDLNSKKKVVAICAQGFLDDVLPILDEGDREDILAFNSQFQEEVSTLARVAHGLIALCEPGREGRKRFALNVAPTVKPTWLASVCFGVMDGKDARMLVLQAVQKHFDDLGIPWRGQ